MRTSIVKLLLSVVLVVVGIWVFINVYNNVLGIGERGDTVVPDVQAKTVREAKEMLEKNGLAFFVSRSEYNPTIPKDSVVSQDPDAGMRVKKGRPVQVVVSSGPEMTQVPDLRGLDLREAMIQLENSRLKGGNIQYVTHLVAKKNVVVDQTPIAGKEAQLNSAVDLSVSVGAPPEITMPKLVGDDLTEAKTALQDAKLRTGQVAWKLDPNRPAGEILTQNPTPSAKVHEGDMVSLVVSAGNQRETLPFKQSYITISLPPFEGEEEVSVWVTDETSTNLAYRGVHHGREKIELMVSGYGNSKVEVYLGSKLLSSGQL